MRKAICTAIVLLIFPAFTASAAMLEGTVQQIDKSKKQIVLNTPNGSETVEFSGTTKGAEKVKAGDKVKVTYRKSGQKLVASAIAEDKIGSSTFPSDRSEKSPKSRSESPMGVR
jgi:hypothetical protein